MRIPHATRSAGGFVLFEGWRLGFVRLLDSFHRLVLLRRKFRLDLDGFDLDELSRLVNAFIVGIPPSALLGGPGWALLLWLKGDCQSWW